ncbi:hypothetical protein PAXINDRAFT_173232 [Paxillus involutus ATCC 200175]|uniref:Uncharacterized protein n=1 Tax=Paxillus involutus ATCC 200175 TaxID=664439 RepID=A0A0C9TKF4_PAXIN|nr:hypothetical protein PAXINDRAFT_173232 [Paxillus involutus ATCC 200175]
MAFFRAISKFHQPKGGNPLGGDFYNEKSTPCRPLPTLGEPLARQPLQMTNLPNHPARSVALSNLAMSKFISSRARGTHQDLDVSIFLFKDALDLRPRDHPDHPLTMLKLAVALLSRFNK